MDCSKKGYYLYTAPAHVAIDLKALGKALNVSGGGVRFAPADALKEKLSVLQGSVNPFAIMFDSNREVILTFHAAIWEGPEEQLLWFHPMSNDSTLVRR